MASANRELLDHAFGQFVLRRNQRDNEAQQAYPFNIFVRVHTALRAVGKIQYANKHVVVDKRKADKAPRRKVLVTQQRVLRSFFYILHKQRLSCSGNLSRNAFPNANAHAN